MSKDLFGDLTAGSIDERYNKLHDETVNKMTANEIEETIKEYQSREQDLFWAKEVVSLFNKVSKYDEEVIKYITNYYELETLNQKANDIISEEQRIRAKRIQDEINERNARLEREKLELEQSLKEYDSRLLTLYTTKVKGEFWIAEVETLYNEINSLSDNNKKKLKNLKYVDDLENIIPLVKKALSIDKKILLLEAVEVKDKKWCEKILNYQIDAEYINYVTQKDVLQSLIVSANTILSQIEQEKQDKANARKQEAEERARFNQELKDLEAQLMYEARMKEFEKECEIQEKKKQEAQEKLLQEFENINRNFCLNFNIEVVEDKICLVSVKDEMPKKLIVPRGVHIIGEKAFEYINDIESVELSDTVEKICAGAFTCCKNLTTFKIGGGLKEINVTAFYGCDKLKGFKISNSNDKFEEYKGDIFSKGLREFYCYAPGKTAKKFKFPPQTTDVLYSAFMLNKHIKVVDCNKVKSLAVEVFKDCENLKVVKLGKNMSYIFDRCFTNCVNLKRVVVKHRVTASSKYSMFKDCKKLDKKCMEYFKGFREK